MARKSLPRPAPAGDTLIAEQPSLASAANQLSAHSAAIAERFGDGLPYDRARIVNEARFYMAQSAEAMLEAGKRLVLLKENEPHGEFTRIVEEQLGLAPQVARRMMQASVKFLGPDFGGAKRSTLSVLGKSKLYELMVLDDDELDALADGGTVVGLEQDDIDRMTARELRLALRDARANATAQARVMTDKNAKLDELAAALASRAQQIESAPPDPAGERLRAEASTLAFEAEAALRGNLRNALRSMTAHAQAHGAAHGDFMAGLLCQIESALGELRDEFDLKRAPGGEAAPDWLSVPPPLAAALEATES
ncbi:DUF3102 domain-containing protein [Trinickia sp. YCB016]